MPTIVQTATQDGTTPISVVMPGNVTAGNLLVLFLSGTPNLDSSVVYSDSRGLTYISASFEINPNGSQTACEIVIAPITSSGPQTITRTCSGSSYKLIRAVEISGIGSPIVDSSNGGIDHATTSVTTGSVTSANSTLMLLGVAADDQSASDFNSTTPNSGTQYFSTWFQACYIDFVGANTYSFTAGKTGAGNRLSAAAALISFVDSTYVFSDSLSYSDSVSYSVTGAIPTQILITDNFISLVDSVGGNFAVQPPPHRGNIDYDQIRVAARSGAGSKLLTTTGSNTDGHGVIFSGGDLIDSGSAPGGGGTWGSITGTLSSQTDLQSALDAKLDDSQLDTDGTLAANSDSKIASQKAIKTYVDAHSGGVIGAANFNGNGSISNTYYAGVISSVTRLSTGRYQVNLSATIADFSISLTVSDDNIAAMTAYLSGSPDFHAGVSSFIFYCFALGSAPRDCQSITVALMKADSVPPGFILVNGA